jgi:hypothetical protein
LFFSSLPLLLALFNFKRKVGIMAETEEASASSKKPIKRLVGRRQQPNPIEIANKESDEDFIQEYVKPR